VPSATGPPAIVEDCKTGVTKEVAEVTMADVIVEKVEVVRLVDCDEGTGLSDSEGEEVVANVSSRLDVEDLADCWTGAPRASVE
jgi:hypothetical protein